MSFLHAIFLKPEIFIKIIFACLKIQSQPGRIPFSGLSGFNNQKTVPYVSK